MTELCAPTFKEPTPHIHILSHLVHKCIRYKVNAILHDDMADSLSRDAFHEGIISPESKRRENNIIIT